MFARLYIHASQAHKPGWLGWLVGNCASIMVRAGVGWRLCQW